MDSANNLAWESSGAIKKGGMNSDYIAQFISRKDCRFFFFFFLVYNAKVTFSLILLLGCILRVQAIFSTIKT